MVRSSHGSFLGRSPEHPKPALRGSPDRRRHLLAVVPLDHIAAAAADHSVKFRSGRGGAFTVFDLVYVMTQEGPVEATNVAMTDIHREAFQFYHFGYSAALSVVQLGLVTIVSLAILFVSGRQGKVLGKELA